MKLAPKNVSGAALAFSVVMWGLTPVGTKYALQYVSLSTLLFARFTVTFVASAIALLFLQGRTGTLSLWDYAKISLLSLIGVTGYQFFITSALDRLAANVGGVVLGLEPVLIQTLTYIVAKDRQRLRLRLVPLALGLAGVAFISLTPSHSGSVNALGVLLAFIAALSWSIFVTASHHTIEKVGYERFSLLSTAVGSLAIASVVGLTEPHLNVLIELHTLQAAATILALALLATVAAMMMWNYAANKVSIQIQGVTLYAIPLISALGGATLLGERISTHLILGGAAVMLSIYLTLRSS